jgi:hypothetical protein
MSCNLNDKNWQKTAEKSVSAHIVPVSHSSVRAKTTHFDAAKRPFSAQWMVANSASTVSGKKRARRSIFDGEGNTATGHNSLVVDAYVDGGRES